MKKYILSCGVIIVHHINQQPHYLLLRAYSNWDFPKGLVEPDEEPLDAAKREVKEETTLDELEFHWGEIYRETEPYSRGKIARYYLAESKSEEVDLPVSPELGKPEHDEYRWVTYQQAMALLAPRLHSIMDWAHGTISKKS